MSPETVLFVLVVGYVVVVVLWLLTVSNSLYALAVLRARLRGLVARPRPRSRRYVVAALVGAAVAGLTAVGVVVIRDAGSTGEASPEAVLGPQSADPAHLRPSRPFVPPTAARSQVHRATRVTSRKPRPRAQGAREQTTKTVSVVRVSARVVPAESTTAPRQVAPSTGATPLPAPAGNSTPTPLPAP